ncbi:RNase A-like domain-containing protein [Streptomyces sp. NPDC059874]|uniref:RNase A-like domain-containing protein n=1 Tax=Streptomyces sp. NPDC059874 TaxID=3346983 RepID=UPI0036682C97
MAGTAPPPPNQNGGFDVQPVHVYHASQLLQDAQLAHDKRASALVDTLNKYNQSAGRGSGAHNFAFAYMMVVEKFLEVWGRSVVSVGGAAVGLTVTANHYVLADWEASGRKGAQPKNAPEPAVINKPPRYGPVNSIKWSGTGEDADSWWFTGAIGEFPDALAAIAGPSFQYALRQGKTHEISPGFKQDEGRDMAKSWRLIAGETLKASDEFTDAISTITDTRGNGEWQRAMRAFGQSVWGTTEWGRARDGNLNRDVTGRNWRTNRDVSPSANRPIVDVLKKTADTVQETLDHLAQVMDTTRATTERCGSEAARAMVKDLTTGLDLKDITKLAVGAIVGEVVLSFRSHMDEATVNAAVENYHREFQEAADKLMGLVPELEEAILSAPTYQSEIARAQGFGARSLNEFKQEHRWQRGGESPTPFMYSFDLATNEDLGGGHTLDKHVGKTDEQLLQRHRDESKPSGKLELMSTSSFADFESAQKYTQYNIRKNTTEIQDWLKNPPPSPPSKTFQVPSVPMEGPLQGNAVTGRTSERLDATTAGPVRDAHGVSTRIKYDPNLNPPFVVVTSMPE